MLISRKMYKNIFRLSDVEAKDQVHYFDSRGKGEEELITSSVLSGLFTK